MRLFAIGDLHGCYTALQTLIETVPITPKDLMITLGDYVDRGPDSRLVVQWIIDRSARAECIPLRGNHEIMLLDALKGRIPLQHWLQFGGDTVLESYAPPGRAGMPEDIPIQHLRFLDRELLPFYETKTHLFAHACPDAQVPMRQQTDDALYWARFDNIEPHVSGKTVICGHTAQKSGVPLNRGFAVCIDTWVYGKGWLTCLEPATGQYWQANQQGESRSGWLEEPAT